MKYNNSEEISHSLSNTLKFKYPHITNNRVKIKYKIACMCFLIITKNNDICIGELGYIDTPLLLLTGSL